MNEDPNLTRALAAYRVPDVSRDLTDDVLAAIARPPRSRWPVIAAGLAAAAIAVVLLRSHAPASEGGEVVITQETIALGSRGKAVAEAGADVRWQIADGIARVEQRAGSVFYRVEPGGAFVVHTPAGTVEVTGTCFRVEVEPMKLSRQQVIAAGLGAVAAAAIVVVVYEGGVRVVNAHGTVELAPGETGRADPSSAPTRGSGKDVVGLARLGADASRGELLAERAAIRDQLEAATAKIKRLEKQLAEVREGPINKIDPTKEQLLAWASRCEVHIDAPDVFGATAARLDAKTISEWGLSATEAPQMEHALGEMHELARSQMREIYLVATGNTAVADEVTAGAMFGEIFDKATPAEKLKARERLARERAGLQPPPPNLTALPPVERALRLLLRLGNDYEQMLGTSLTPGRAHDLRKMHNNWPGLSLDQEGCDEG